MSLLAVGKSVALVVRLNNSSRLVPLEGCAVYSMDVFLPWLSVPASEVYDAPKEGMCPLE